MTREGHERRSKHREVAGASGSSRGPVAQPKKLAKRAQPSSLHEDSSPEDSPPHGPTPSSPNEFECLKMRSPKVHTNREVVNYNKVTAPRECLLQQVQGKGHGWAFLDFLPAGLLSHCALPEDQACCSNAVGSPWLYEEEDGCHLQQNSWSLWISWHLLHSTVLVKLESRDHHRVIFHSLLWEERENLHVDD
jgi:hypothetical protein